MSVAKRNNLTPRQREILRILVKEYVASANPVGSVTIQKLGNLQVSSATIRNELAALEEAGYLVQPHTSAGRIPTVRGYRYFVEQLMERVELPVTKRRMISHQFHQIRPNLVQWMRLTAAVLAHSAQSASLITPPHAPTARFRHMELISTCETTCLLILVLQDGSVHQEILVTNGNIDQEALSKVSGKLNALLRNLSTDEIIQSTHPELINLQGWEAGLLEHILWIMRQVDRRAFKEIYHDGLVHILGQPEFSETARSRRLVELLEHRGLLEPILRSILQAKGVQIIIGGEGIYEQIADVTLVLSPYGIRGEASGVLGVMGPTRMRYAHAISTVEYIARLMGELIADVYDTSSG